MPEKQFPPNPVKVGSWPQEDEYLGVYSKGARDKTSIFCPHPSPFPFLISGHRYLFKQSNKNYPEQFWVEIFSYQLGQLMNVRVPPSFVAFDENKNICGALIEWFWVPSVITTYIDGGDLMNKAIQEYDLKRGDQHNFKTIQIIAGAFNAENWLTHWAKVFTFDTIIGNTDRHHDNWGLILKLNADPANLTSVFSPAFDNGTSLGHEQISRNFSKFDSEGYLKRYVERGHHHMRWNLQTSNKISHFDFMRLFLKQFPAMKETVRSCLLFSEVQIEEILRELTQFVLPVRLTPERAKFMKLLIFYRKKQLEATI